MALRLIEVVLPEKDGVEVRDLLKEYKVLEFRQVQLLGGEVLMRILLDAEQSEPVLDLLGKRHIGREGNRIVVMSVEATLPRVELESKPTVASEQPPPEEKTPGRVGREELYEDIKSVAQCSRVYIAMIVLSTILAAIGLQRDSATIIIGAMVIAPLLGPSMALALGTTLGDLSLLWQALRTSLIGILLAMFLSLMIGTLMHVEPTLSEVVLRTRVEWGDIVLALAAGSAGALAFTSGSVSGALIGVMVAVALLPPLVTFGLLLSGGYPLMAMGALVLFLVNLNCVNLAGVVTFLAQGIRPANWWEKGLAAKATRIAVTILLVSLILLTGLILLLQQGKI
ncbi:MAG: hypothetical protein ACD_21C00095G0005 [uncultured bacterium]|nr:MAG: hypothetical protein ACD_21C00095G0005 [uncultured bacterium]